MRYFVIPMLLGGIFLSFIMSNGDVKFSSTYTKLNDDNCRMVEPIDGLGDGYVVCPVIEGYEAYIFYDLYGNDMLSVRNKTANYEESPIVNDCGISQRYGGTIEWRTADGAPFAGIVRIKCLGENEEGFPGKQISEHLIVFGLAGYESISGSIDVKTTPEANKAARNLAEDAFLKLQK